MARNVAPLRSLGQDPNAPVLLKDVWPATLAPIAQLLEHGPELGPVTVSSATTASGTLVEAIAGAYGKGPQGGSPGSLHTTRRSESTLA